MLWLFRSFNYTVTQRRVNATILKTSLSIYIYFLIFHYFSNAVKKNQIPPCSTRGSRYTSSVPTVIWQLLLCSLMNKVTGEKKSSVLTWVLFLCEAYAPRVDVSGLVAGIVAVLVIAVIAAVLGIYCYKSKQKSARRSPQYIHTHIHLFFYHLC